MKLADKDGDLCFTTNNKVLVQNYHRLPTIFCLQRRAEKKVPTEEDIVTANKLSFGDEIGAITNVITSQICLQASFAKGTKEYDEMTYRVLCGQIYQQNAIDKAKGIIAKPMPKYWKSKYGLKEEEADSDEIKEHKQFLKRIAADRKPYFFIYNYDTLHAEYSRYLKKAHNAYMCEYGSDLLEDFELFKMDRDSWGIKRRTFFEYFDKFLPVDMSPCTMNRICWAIEKQTKDMTISVNGDYDWRKLKSPHPEYSTHVYYKVRPILAKEYGSFQEKLKDLNVMMKNEYIHGMDMISLLQNLTDAFLRKFNLICPDEELKCDILLEIAYKSNKSKKLVWELCGNQIVKNLLSRHGNRVSYPVIADINPDFEYCGIGYSMVTDIVDIEVYDE